MASSILINVRPSAKRLALIEDNELRDIKIETNGEALSLVGSIYMARVIRVLPGMQAAFVDIGLDRAAFLYAGDVRKGASDPSESMWTEEQENTEGLNFADEGEGLPTHNTDDKTPIQELLNEGQQILVQVAKDPLGTKGARVTTHISLPGRYVVYMPTVNHVGISRRIEKEEDREALRQIVESERKGKGGFIVRTAAEEADENSVRADMEYLYRVFREVKKSYQRRRTPGLVRAELDMDLKAVRDLANENTENIIIDDLETYKKVSKFVAQFLPNLKAQIQFYDKERPLFDQYGVDLEVSRSLERKIWLKSGGYIIIDEAEALVAIDVNTGSFVGKKDLEDTILKTNLEAVKEIAHQLRIRNCGGIIIIDLIDMEKDVNREKVMEALKEELSKDKAKTNVSGMSSLGLVEMTRKRTRPSLVKSLCEACSYCEGRGYTKTSVTVANEIFIELERELMASNIPSLVVRCHADVADWVYAEGNSMLEFLEKKLAKSIIFNVDSNFHIEQYEIGSV